MLAIYKEYIYKITMYPFSRKARQWIHNRVKQNRDNIKLIMTLVVKNEEEIIETNIRFHYMMGVDGFIVTSHNSTDKTNNILEQLKKERLVLDIIYQTSPNHQHAIWVNRMIRMATKKHNADWIINADADEFYYSQSLNLKKSIAMVPNTDILWVDSIMLFPDNRKDFLTCPYFVTRRFKPFEAEMLGINADSEYQNFIEPQSCTKVIHKAKRYIEIVDGNHDVKLQHTYKIQSADIRLYHYHTRNYRGYEEKVVRWLESAHLMPDGQGMYMKRIIRMYQEGKLRDNYELLYGANMREFLIKNGVVCVDPSIANFLTYNKLNKK